MPTLARLVSRLLDALSPPACAACDAAAGEVFCDRCAGELQGYAPSTLDGLPLAVGGRYAPPLSTAIVRFKYGGRAELATSLARLMAPIVATLDVPRPLVLVPVPLHRRRLATRGYNQAALLAQALAQELRVPCAPRLLLRTRETEQQVGKSRELRLTNARGAFALNERARSASSPPHIVLVDDVVTTGSTVRACAQALDVAGLRLVAVAAAARADPTGT